MPNLVKYLGITLLAALLAACDGKKEDNAGHADHNAAAAQPAASQTVTLLDGKVSFTLPADMRDQSGKVGTQSNNMHVYANDNGQRAVIVILGSDTSDSLPVLTQRLEDKQRERDTNLQVVTNKSIEINGQTLQQLDSITNSGSGQPVYSSILLGKVNNHLLTLQITLPAENQQTAQSEAESIIHTLALQ